MAEVTRLQFAQKIALRGGPFGVNEIFLDKACYYYVSNERRYDVSIDLQEYFIGRLSEELEFLKTVAKDPYLAKPLGFARLDPIVDYLATQVNWYDGLSGK